jgi:hypothetical protein
LSLLCGEQKRHNPINVKFWEVIADNLSKTGWSLRWVLAVDSEGRTIWIADAHRGDGKRFRCACRRKAGDVCGIEIDSSPEK